MSLTISKNTDVNHDHNAVTGVEYNNVYAIYDDERVIVVDEDREYLNELLNDLR